MMNRGLVWTETFGETRENPCFALERTETIVFTITSNVAYNTIKGALFNYGESVWVSEECEKCRAQK